MASQKQKFDKKKAREKAVRQKVLRRREAIRADAKLKRAEEERLELEYELSHGKREPILSDPVKIAEREARKAAMVEERLKKNLQILEALEAEYNQEQAGREEVNKVLENEGHKSLKDKMQALYAKTLKFKESVEDTRKRIESLGEEVVVETDDEDISEEGHECHCECECTAPKNTSEDKSENIG